MNEKGVHKWVNVDQLKKIETRFTNVPTNHRIQNKEQRNHEFTDIFDEIINDDEVLSSEVIVNDPRDQAQQIGAWCDIDVHNIIPYRTRSGAGGGV